MHARARYDDDEHLNINFMIFISNYMYISYNGVVVYIKDMQSELFENC